MSSPFLVPRFHCVKERRILCLNAQHKRKLNKEKEKRKHERIIKPRKKWTERERSRGNKKGGKKREERRTMNERNKEKY